MLRADRHQIYIIDYLIPLGPKIAATLREKEDLETVINQNEKITFNKLAELYKCGLGLVMSSCKENLNCLI